jgi:hypothetical protein
MKHTFKPRLLKRSIMSLFVTKKPLATYQRHPDAYYMQTWIEKGFAEAIDYLAIEAHKSKKAMVHTFLGIGMTHYISDKIAEYNRQVIAARELGKEPELTHFILMLRRWAKDKGGDISKFI